MVLTRVSSTKCEPYYEKGTQYDMLCAYQHTKLYSIGEQVGHVYLGIKRK